MMINKARSIVGIVTLSSIGLFVSSTIFAQHGPERHGADSGQRQQGHTPNLTGAWTLNKDLSDDPATVMETMKGERRGGSGHGPWMHGGGRRGGMDQAKMQSMHRAMEAPARLSITEANGSITFTDGDGRSQTLTTNNKKEKLLLDNQTVDVRTKWDDGRL